MLTHRDLLVCFFRFLAPLFRLEDSHRLKGTLHFIITFKFAILKLQLCLFFVFLATLSELFILWRTCRVCSCSSSVCRHCIEFPSSSLEYFSLFLSHRLLFASLNQSAARQILKQKATRLNLPSFTPTSQDRVALISTVLRCVV